jgi:hypothetical protein
VQAYRLRDNAQLPGWYSASLHVLCQLSLFALSGVAGMVWLQKTGVHYNAGLLLQLVGLVIVWANIEYLIHRYILHGTTALFRKLAREHSYNHHHYFTDLEMMASARIDVSRVLMLPEHLLSVLLLAALLSAGISAVRPILGAAFFCAGVVYVLIYEILHGFSHLSAGRKIPILGRIFTHHERHHNLKQMRFTNFAIVIPLIDELWGTSESGGQSEKAVENAPN